MNFINDLIALDKSLLLFLNSLHSAFFDNFMFVYTKTFVWIPLYAAVIYAVIRTYGKRSVWLILAFIACVTAADQIASGIIKEAVGRLRPSHNPDFEGIIHLVNGAKAGQFGFVSSHAAHTIGFATLCTLVFRNRIFGTVIFAWAALNCYTRIYLGLHYPLDIIGGSIVGIAVAVIIYLIYRCFFKETKPLATTNLLVPIAALVITVMIMIVYSVFLN